MFIHLNNWLQKPYPFVNTRREKIIMSLVFGNIVFLFLYIFKPFGIDETKNYFLLYTFGFGLVTFLVTLVSFFIFPLFLKKTFNPQLWTIKKMFFFFLGIILLISIANWLYNIEFSYWYFNQLQLHVNLNQLIGFFTLLLYTVLVGFFPILFYIFITEKNSNKQNKLVAKKLSNTKMSVRKTEYNQNFIDHKTTLIATNNKESLTLSIANLVYISSEANYASIFYINDGKQKEILLRSSLTSLEKQLDVFNYVIRCHKSYIVNTHHVINITGNARGYILHLKDTEYTIPVSRNFPKEFLYTLVGI